MRPKRMRAFQLLALAALLTCASCLGPNHLTGRLGKWNTEIDGKWGNEVAFVLLLPVYMITSLGDMLIFNSIQWWTGNNPIDRPGADDTPGPTF